MKLGLTSRFLLFAFICTLGVAVLTLAAFSGTDPWRRINPEYISGILTASAIIFGFWGILIQESPKEKDEEKASFMIVLESNDRKIT